MRKRNFGYFGVVALAALAGCSTDTKEADRADQQQIYQRYSMSYDTEDNRTSVAAQFREAGQEGETIELTGKSNVKHDSLDLDERWELGTHYVAEQAGFVKDHTWTYTDTEGKTYENTFRILEAKLPNELAARQPIAEEFTLAWEGEPVADNDDEVMLLVAPTNAEGVAKSAQRFSVRKAGEKQIAISPDRLKELGEGRHELRLQRVRRIPLKAATNAGGYAETRYVSAPVVVDFFQASGAGAQPKGPEAPKSDAATPAEGDPAAPRGDTPPPVVTPAPAPTTPTAPPVSPQDPGSEPPPQEPAPETRANSPETPPAGDPKVMPEPEEPGTGVEPPTTETPEADAPSQR